MMMNGFYVPDNLVMDKWCYYETVYESGVAISLDIYHDDCLIFSEVANSGSIKYIKRILIGSELENYIEPDRF